MDEAAFEAFYERTRRLVTAVLSRTGITDADDLADLVQETYLKAWRSGLIAQIAYADKNWIATIAKRCAIDFHHSAFRRSQEQRATITDEVFEVLAVDGDAEAGFDLVERSDTFGAALAALDERDRQMIGWLLQEYKQAEIEKEFGLKRTQVQARLRRARKSFLRAYAGDLAHAS